MVGFGRRIAPLFAGWTRLACMACAGHGLIPWRDPRPCLRDGCSPREAPRSRSRPGSTLWRSTSQPRAPRPPRTCRRCPLKTSPRRCSGFARHCYCDHLTFLAGQHPRIHSYAWAHLRLMRAKCPQNYKTSAFALHFAWTSSSPADSAARSWFSSPACSGAATAAGIQPKRLVHPLLSSRRDYRHWQRRCL